MTTLLVLQHVAHEGPARLAQRALARGWSVQVQRLWLGEAVPEALPADCVLAIMGGPMGVGDVGDARFPFLAQEVALLRRVVRAGQPMLGVCLGAQLLAHAAGAVVAPMCVNGDPTQRVREVGWGTVRLTAAGRASPLSRDLPDLLPVMHWHGDACAAPPQAEVLAETPPCPVQWFRLGAAHGLQFHVEMEPDDVRTWVQVDADFVTLAGGIGHGQRIIDGLAQHAATLRHYGDLLLDRLLSELQPRSASLC